MNHFQAIFALALSACLGLAGPAAGAIPENFAPGDYLKPSVCPANYMADVALACVAKKLDSAACLAAGFDFKQGPPPVCVADPAKAPKAACKAISSYAATVNGSGADATCAYERVNPSSAAGDYIGDCFHVKGVPPGTGLAGDRMYFVSGQRNIDGDNDRELTLVPGHLQFFPTLGCLADAGTPVKAQASQLIEAGASRQGYSYGLLTMPYKYFPKDRSFIVGAPVGAYLGWRYGQAGSGTMVALALTLGQVKGETVDPTKLDANKQPTVTGTTDVPALSAAVGVMFDVLKSPRGKPFKAGLFFGRDTVSAEPTIRYRYNRKNWLAVQLGYDFTDN